MDAYSYDRADVQFSERGNVKELASLSLNIQSKKFYLDVKENMSGRFVKIAEINVSGIKNKVILDMTSTRILLDHLVSFADFYVALGPQPMSGGGAAGGSRQQSQTQQGGVSRPLKSDSFKRVTYNRIYHLDLAQNDKGVFLKLSCANQSAGRQNKQTVVFPAQGIVELRDKLKLLVDEFHVEEVEEALPQSKRFTYDSRILFMDVGHHSNRGFYLKLSEISKNPTANYKRQTIQIPRGMWMEVRDALNELYEETESQAQAHQLQHQLQQPPSLEQEMLQAEQKMSATSTGEGDVETEESVAVKGEGEEDGADTSASQATATTSSTAANQQGASSKAAQAQQTSSQQSKNKQNSGQSPQSKKQ